MTDDHSGEVVTWERLRDAHSGMLGTKEWEPSHMDAPNSGHRVYRQGIDEQCYMCAALDLIAKAEAANQALSERIAVLEEGRERLWRELEAAMLAFKRIEQEPRTPTKMRDIAGARAHYASEALGCRKHGTPFISPGICPFCDEESLTPDLSTLRR